MGLIVNKNNSAKMADKDITCYKVVLFENYIPNIVTSKEIGFVYNFKDIYNNGLYLNELPIIVNEERKYVSRRLFHSYKNLTEAQTVCNSNEYIAKCTIPKGAYYFEGIVKGQNIHGYASSQIKIDYLIKL